MTTAVDNWPAYARLVAVAAAGQLSTAPTPLPGTQPSGWEKPGNSDIGNATLDGRSERSAIGPICLLEKVGSHSQTDGSNRHADRHCKMVQCPEGLLGFIAQDGGGPDAFVHVSAIQRAGLQVLNEGQRVQFDLVNDPRKGKSSAENLKAL